MSDSCCICLEKITDLSTPNKCKHQFCFVCIAQWATVATNCPLCKVEFSAILRSQKLPFRVEQKKARTDFYEEEFYEEDEEEADSFLTDSTSDTLDGFIVSDGEVEMETDADDSIVAPSRVGSSLVRSLRTRNILLFEDYDDRVSNDTSNDFEDEELSSSQFSQYNQERYDNLLNDSPREDEFVLVSNSDSDEIVVLGSTNSNLTPSASFLCDDIESDEEPIKKEEKEPIDDDIPWMSWGRKSNVTLKKQTPLRDITNARRNYPRNCKKL